MEYLLTVLFTIVSHLLVNDRQTLWLLKKQDEQLRVGFLRCHVQGCAAAFQLLLGAKSGGHVTCRLLYVSHGHVWRMQ